MFSPFGAREFKFRVILFLFEMKLKWRFCYASHSYFIVSLDIKNTNYGVVWRGVGGLQTNYLKKKAFC